MNTTDPFDLLLDLERRTIKGSAGLPTLDEVRDEWVGVGFRIGDSKLIASMADVKEILHLPEFTKVPGVKSWVIGVANVRGSLLPIMDMKSYLLGEDIKNRQKGRVIVIEYKGFNTGMVVEEVYGMRHFREGDVSEDVPEVHESMSAFISGAYKQEDEHWPIFNFNEMTQDDEFSRAAL